ncbi:uncharacterized protein LOC133174095 [Saccostrea echinata]|uniref:uncharacterized protein LOC133174095 n=1 Tax=Saccostrea echinata TaxID=191078 RepID=UPI002A831434|nr:uncharacterized protein LOC133174095 [Saccostrea echinata]
MRNISSLQAELLVLFSVLPLPFVAEYLETTFSKVTSLSNKKAISNLLWQKSGSKMACLAACATDSRCVSCFLDGQSYCSGHHVIYTPSSTVQNSPGLSYYEIQDPASKLGCVAVPGDTGYCVRLNLTKLSWPDQVLACQTENMRLASLSSDLRVTFVQNYLLGIGHSQAVTVGASLTSGTWYWMSGDILSPISPHWGPSEPTSGPGEECVIMAFAIGFRFNDGQCTTLKSFLCDMFYVAN